MILLDSSFLVAFHNARDVHHDAAVEIMERIVTDEWGAPVLLEYVFLEVVTVLLARRGLAKAVEVGDILLNAREVQFVPCSENFDESWYVFTTQPSRRLSFTDSALVAVGNQRDIQRIATFDQGFYHLRALKPVPEPAV
ncbi:MAG TPA: PIN domain-containing protein [Woeseiaceae bacterium]|nr:PIN domain-containing protein [Woeseiaceae bacterium]